MFLELPIVYQDHSYRERAEVLLHCSHIAGRCGGEDFVPGEELQ